MKKEDKIALVIFSGGQDSTTCLYWALNRYKKVEAITFNYGQKHSIELECSKNICEKNNVKQTIIDISFLDTIVESALTSNGDVNKLNEKGLPDSFVPNRNQLFITLSHSYLQKIKGDVLITGVCQTDFSGYPDCRRDFIDSIEKTSNMGSLSDIEILTPLMYIDKEETFKLAADENCLEDVLKMSHTCYNGNREKLNDYGYGCDECPACNLRREGYKKYMSNNG